MRTAASRPRRLALPALVITNAAPPSASIGHSSARIGSAIMRDASTCSTVSVLPRYIAFGFSCAHLRRVTHTEASCSGVDPVVAM